MFTGGASVHINAMNAEEDGSDESTAFIKYVHSRPWPVFSPTLLLIEVAATMARRIDDAERALAVARPIRNLRGQIWVALDEALAEAGSHLAAERRHTRRGCCLCSHGRQNTILVTRDRQQLECLRPQLTVMTPAEALVHLDEASQSCE
jgi:hypothetical protein